MEPMRTLHSCLTLTWKALLEFFVNMYHLYNPYNGLLHLCFLLKHSFLYTLRINICYDPAGPLSCLKQFIEK